MLILIVLVTLIATVSALYGFSIIRENARLVSGSSLKTNATRVRKIRNATDDIAAEYLKTLAR